MAAILKPPDSCSIVSVALQSRLSGGWPAPLSWKAVAMLKQPAWAAAISSSGLVPFSSPKRILKLYGVSFSVPLCVVR